MRPDRIGAVIVLLLPCGAVHTLLAQPAENRFLATPIQTFIGPADRPVVMPTAVAVDPTGRVFVVDGVNDRILAFDSDGRLVGEIVMIGNERLSRPISAKFDGDGRLWVADTGHQRILVRGPDGNLDRIIPIPTEDNGHIPDVTDLAVPANNGHVWIVDNDNHRVGYFDLTSSTWTFVGGQGESLGRFHYPFMIASGTNDEVFISDTINGRVQALRGVTILSPGIGRYGVDLGELYRPKGIVCDDRGNIWVSDGPLGVVQVFTRQGNILDVVRDERGDVLRMQTPSGLAFDTSGHLYVIEMTPGRVRKFQIQREEAAPRASRPLPTPMHQVQPAACTVCHLDWMSPFAKGEGTVLMDAPVSRPDEPYVSRAETCFSCHDGSVVDSRGKVWREHSHRTDMTPPEGMMIPADLPLVNDRIACRTCHSAHTHGGSGQTMRNAVFLRVERHPDELCVRCHSDLYSQSSAGTHPTRAISAPIPEELIAAGAKGAQPPEGGPPPVEVGEGINGCMICHTAHGSADNRLLISTKSPNRLCLSCHEKINPDAFAQRQEANHPIEAVLNDAQRTAVAAHGGWTDSNGGVLCVSCHRMHHGVDGGYLLRDTLHGSRHCMQCHPQYELMYWSSHDLRRTAPTAVNAKGATCDVAGPCSACHNVHSRARVPIPTSLDTKGFCIPCHRQEGCASSATGSPFSHPSNITADLLDRLSWTTKSNLSAGHFQENLHCTSCHNPHSVRQPMFLRADPDHLCAACHPSQSQSLAGGHDFMRRPASKNGKDRTLAESGRCGFCHAVHDAKGPALWTATSEPPDSAEALCTACHTSGNSFEARVVGRILHPAQSSHGAAMSDNSTGVPLFDHQGRRDPQGSVACATCHDPHANVQQTTALLRNVYDNDSEPLCMDCHVDTQSMEMSFHSEDSLEGYAGSNTTCGPCHVVHAPLKDWPVDMWAGPVGNVSDPPGIQHCTGCHSSSSGWSDVAFLEHPALPMANVQPPDTAGFMPLVDSFGNLNAAGQIVCVTCHLPHGRAKDGGFIPLDFQTEPLPSIHAAKPMLRPYIAPNLCTSCHGFDGLSKFLYFHKSSRQQVRFTSEVPFRD